MWGAGRSGEHGRRRQGLKWGEDPIPPDAPAPHNRAVVVTVILPTVAMPPTDPTVGEGGDTTGPEHTHTTPSRVHPHSVLRGPPTAWWLGPSPPAHGRGTCGAPALRRRQRRWRPAGGEALHRFSGSPAGGALRRDAPARHAMLDKA